MEEEYIKLGKPTIISSKDFEDAKALNLENSPFYKPLEELVIYFYNKEEGIDGR